MRQASSSYLIQDIPTVILAAAQSVLMALMGYETHDVTMYALLLLLTIFVCVCFLAEAVSFFLRLPDSVM